MTTKYQKCLEVFFAESAGKLLREPWKIETSPNEKSWPDLMVDDGSRIFGLEVREIYADESRKGSITKANESKNIKSVRNLANAYYGDKSNLAVNIHLLGNISDHVILLNTIKVEVSHMSDFQQKRIEPYTGCVIYVRKLPEIVGQYKKWTYISDKVGWVSVLEKTVIEHAIDEKSKKLKRYRRNVQDVRLLLVSNKLYNSGLSKLERGIKFDNRGFNIVYYLEHPEDVSIISQKI